MTTAEWKEFRFGSGKQGQLSRVINAVANVVLTVAMIGYFFVGTGKFLSLFLPFSPFVCSMIMVTVALFYTTMGGLYGVVYTDLLQALFIGFATLYVSVRAFLLLSGSPDMIPSGWLDLSPKWFLDMPSGYEIYNLFALSVLFFFVKVVLEGFGGQQGMIAQRYFAASSDRDSGRLSALWTICLMLRWPFIIGIAVLALTLGPQIREPEMALPQVLSLLIPSGIKGLILAALIAAAMSTFDSTINAGASYVIRDIYQKYIRPDASERRLIRASYAASAGIVILGICIGAATPSINAIWGWITMSLGAGMLFPLLLRWYWWRFNEYGYSFETIVGMSSAIIQKILMPGLPEWAAFLMVGSVSLAGMVAITLMSPPTDRNTLRVFYEKTRPPGFWRPVKLEMDESFLSSVKRENRRDLWALCFAVPWQLSLFLTGHSSPPYT